MSFTTRPQSLLGSSEPAHPHETQQDGSSQPGTKPGSGKDNADLHTMAEIIAEDDWDLKRPPYLQVSIRCARPEPTRTNCATRLCLREELAARAVTPSCTRWIQSRRDSKAIHTGHPDTGVWETHISKSSGRKALDAGSMAALLLPCWARSLEPSCSSAHMSSQREGCWTMDSIPRSATWRPVRPSITVFAA